MAMDIEILSFFVYVMQLVLVFLQWERAFQACLISSFVCKECMEVETILRCRYLIPGHNYDKHMLLIFKC
ncbi:hypothetical protein V6Z11_A06G011900 [Gossypium hirsutum]